MKRRQPKLQHEPPPAPPPVTSTEIPKWVPRDPYRPIDPNERQVDFYEPSYVRGPVLDKK